MDPNIEPPVVIHSVEHTPWQARQMRLPAKMQEQSIKIFRDEIKNRMLEPSMGPYQNQYFLVPKKDGRYRLILDLQPCNKVTIKDSAVPPNVEEITQSLAGAVCYSGFDLFSGYDQIPLSEESRDIVTIMTPLGPLRKTKLPQGFTNSVAIF